MNIILSILLLTSLINFNVKASGASFVEPENEKESLSNLKSLSTALNEIDISEISQNNARQAYGAIYEGSFEKDKTLSASKITSQSSSVFSHDAFIEFLKSRPVVISPYEGTKEYTYHQQVSERFFRRPPARIRP